MWGWIRIRMRATKGKININKQLIPIMCWYRHIGHYSSYSTDNGDLLNELNVEWDSSLSHPEYWIVGRFECN